MSRSRMPTIAATSLSSQSRVALFDPVGQALTPTTPSNARKLVRDHAATRIYEDGVFKGIRLIRPLGDGRVSPLASQKADSSS